jgi:hypothetical protein
LSVSPSCTGSGAFVALSMMASKGKTRRRSVTPHVSSRKPRDTVPVLYMSVILVLPRNFPRTWVGVALVDGFDLDAVLGA